VRSWLVTIGYSGLFGLATMACTLVGLRNLSRARHVRQVPPLETGEIVASAPPSRKVPAGWPEPVAITDRRVAAAYRDYARERADVRAMAGELLILASGAALGAAVPGLVAGNWRAIPGGVALAAGAVGVQLRRGFEHKWTRIATRYELRRRELGAPAESPVPAPRRRRLFRWRTTR
jgi:hypothetical protein